MQDSNELKANEALDHQNSNQNQQFFNHILQFPLFLQNFLPPFVYVIGFHFGFSCLQVASKLDAIGTHLATRQLFCLNIFRLDLLLHHSQKLHIFINKDV